MFDQITQRPYVEDHDLRQTCSLVLSHNFCGYFRPPLWPRLQDADREPLNSPWNRANTARMSASASASPRNREYSHKRLQLRKRNEFRQESQLELNLPP